MTSSGELVKSCLKTRVGVEWGGGGGGGGEQGGTELGGGGGGGVHVTRVSAERNGYLNLLNHSGQLGFSVIVNNACVVLWSLFCHWRELPQVLFLSRQNTSFVATNKRFVAASILLSRQKTCFVATKMIPVAAVANDTVPRERVCAICLRRSKF